MPTQVWDKIEMQTNMRRLEKIRKPNERKNPDLSRRCNFMRCLECAQEIVG